MNEIIIQLFSFLAIKLESQEKEHILLKAHRIMNKTDKPNYTKKLFNPRPMKSHEKDIELACLDFARKMFYNEPAQNQLESTSAVNTSTGEKSKPEALLIVGWQAVITDTAGNKRTAIGQNHLSISTLSWGCANIDTSFVLPAQNDTSLDQSIMQPLLSSENKTPALQKQVQINTYIH